MRAQRSNIVRASDGSGVAGGILGGIFGLITAPYRAKLEAEDFIQKQDYLHGHRKDLITTEWDRRDQHAKVKGTEERQTMSHEVNQTLRQADEMIARPGLRQARGITLDAGAHEGKGVAPKPNNSGAFSGASITTPGGNTPRPPVRGTGRGKGNGRGANRALPGFGPDFVAANTKPVEPAPAAPAQPKESRHQMALFTKTQIKNIQPKRGKK